MPENRSYPVDYVTAKFRPPEPAQAAETSPAAPVKLQRHFLTGEWQEVPMMTDSGRATIYSSEGPGETRLERRDYNRELKPLSIPPEQATPERVRQFNEESRKHNTGAIYDRDGRCHTTSRRSQNREMKLRNKQNNNAGYSDWAGR